jgi:hypothetical protein
MASIIRNALASMEGMEVKLEITQAPVVKEDVVVPKMTTTVVTNTTTVAKPVDDKEEVKIVLDGPLSSIYFKALNIAYAKPDPVTGMVSTESLALTDYYRAAEIQKKLASEVVTHEVEEAVSSNPSSTALVAPMTKDEVIPVVKELIDVSGGAPTDFCIVFNTMAPTHYSPMGSSDGVEVVVMDRAQPIAFEDIEGVTIFVKMKKK